MKLTSEFRYGSKQKAYFQLEDQTLAYVRRNRKYCCLRLTFNKLPSNPGQLSYRAVIEREADSVWLRRSI